MTKRDYLSTLDSSALAEWILYDAVEIARMGTQSRTFLTEWLDSEYSGWINMRERSNIIMQVWRANDER